MRVILVLKVASLARGHSGVRPELIELLLQLYNRGIYPCIPSKGSVGASGDLAPLAHLSLALLGLGDVRVHGLRVPAASALKNEKLRPIKLAPKEGLALLNGTQVSTALALVNLFRAERMFRAALTIGVSGVAADQVEATLKQDLGRLPLLPGLHVHHAQAGHRVGVPRGLVDRLLDAWPLVRVRLADLLEQALPVERRERAQVRASDRRGRHRQPRSDVDEERSGVPVGVDEHHREAVAHGQVDRCDYPVQEAVPLARTERTFVRMFPEPDDGFQPSHIVNEPTSKIEVLQAEVPIRRAVYLPVRTGGLSTDHASAGKSGPTLFGEVDA